MVIEIDELNSIENVPMHDKTAMLLQKVAIIIFTTNIFVK